MLSLFKSSEYNLKFRIIRFYGVYWFCWGGSLEQAKTQQTPGAYQERVVASRKHF